MGILESNPRIKNIDVHAFSPGTGIPQPLLAARTDTLPQEEMDLYQVTMKPRRLGPCPPDGFQSETVEAWADMRELCGKMVSQMHQSPYRIVLSYYSGDAMTITSRQTSKVELIPYLHTPTVVGIDPAPGKYYGSDEYSPSTEAVPHWIIHTTSAGEHADGRSALIHCHPQQLLTLLASGKGQMLDKDAVIPHQVHGTRALGESLARALANHRSAILEDHGVWTLGSTFAEAHTKLLELTTDVQRLLREG